jgi:hypothetical protein
MRFKFSDEKSQKQITAYYLAQVYHETGYGKAVDRLNGYKEKK